MNTMIIDHNKITTFEACVKILQHKCINHVHIFQCFQYSAHGYHVKCINIKGLPKISCKCKKDQIGRISRFIQIRYFLLKLFQTMRKLQEKDHLGFFLTTIWVFCILASGWPTLEDSLKCATYTSIILGQKIIIYSLENLQQTIAIWCFGH